MGVLLIEECAHSILQFKARLVQVGANFGLYHFTRGEHEYLLGGGGRGGQQQLRTKNLFIEIFFT